jgi:hypothetical protein
MLVNEDQGAVVDGRHVDVGASITSGLESSAALMSRLRLQPATLANCRRTVAGEPRREPRGRSDHAGARRDLTTSGKQLSELATPPVRANPVLTAQLANPLALMTTTYRPLPDRSALGLSAFYIALLSILSGFIGATLITDVGQAIDRRPQPAGASDDATRAV